MPTDASVDDRGTGFLDRFRQHHYFFPTLSVRNQIQHRQAIDDDEILAHRFAHAGDDFHRQAHAIRIAAPPFIGPLVGVRDQKFVDEIAFRAHYLHAVVTGFAREFARAHEAFDLAFDSACGKFARRERRDRRADL